MNTYFCQVQRVDANKIYEQLKQQFGIQGWWPVYTNYDTWNTRQGGFLYGVTAHEREGYRSKWRDPWFEIAVGAILTQNTGWTNVEKAMHNLYSYESLTPEKISALDAETLQGYIRPSGYFRQKEKKLRLFADWVLTQVDGDLRQLHTMPPKDRRTQLLDLWGIGPETADSILLYALDQPVFVIDTYTKRLLKQYDVAFSDYHHYQQFFHEQLPRDAALFQEFHALIVAWGKSTRRVENDKKSKTTKNPK